MHKFNFSGHILIALPSGTLWWPDQKLLTVSDLHLGKSERISRRGGPILPPYETQDTLSRLERDIDRCAPATVICLGDSFDDLQAGRDLPDAEKSWLNRLQAGRRWIWIEGNHDPGPISIGGSHLSSFSQSDLSFRHIATPGARGEISGHYHPKFSLRAKGHRITRRCFIYDETRAILPAYGTYIGGLKASDPALQALFSRTAKVVMCGTTTHVLALHS